MASGAALIKASRLALVLLIIFSLTVLASRPVESVFSESDKGSLQSNKKVLGSRPPLCMNKCSSCRPCMATLVALPRGRSFFSASRHEADDSYYLLAWKCQCGNKLYQP